MENDIDPGELPAFAPVPRRARKGGWTDDKQRGFIAALAETGNVRMAAERVGMTKEGAYHLRLAPGAESFSAAWQAAQERGLTGLRDLAIERAQEGVVQPVFDRMGKQVGEKRVYNDRLLMFTLKHHSDLSQIGRGTLSAQRQAQIESRKAVEEAPDDETMRQKLMEMFDRMEQRLLESIRDGTLSDPSQMSAAERMVLGLPPYLEDLKGDAAMAFHGRNWAVPEASEDGTAVGWTAAGRIDPERG